MGFWFWFDRQSAIVASGIIAAIVTLIAGIIIGTYVILLLLFPIWIAFGFSFFIIMWLIFYFSLFQQNEGDI